MKAESISLEDFLSTKKTRFIIPVYQRNYDWKEENCQQFFNDIKSLLNPLKKSHFLGSVVYVTNSDVDSISLKEWVIIDGQQRITTSILFLKALLDSTDNENLRKELIEDFIENTRLDDKNKLKLKPIKKDNEVFESIIKDDFTNINKHSNIFKNYEFFKRELSGYSDLESLFKAFNKLFIVGISLNRAEDNPQLIFESINSTGVNLSQADLIRNYLLMDKTNDIQTLYFEKYWIKIEEVLGNENISMFIRDYLTMKKNKLQNKERTYEDFKEFVNITFEDTEDLLKDLLHYSLIYQSFLHEDIVDEIYNPFLQKIKVLKVAVIYPFLMSVISDFKNKIITDIELLKSFDILESYIVRRSICSKNSNVLNGVFSMLYEDVKSLMNFDSSVFSKFLATALLLKKGTAAFPSNSDFKSEFLLRDFYSFKNSKFVLSELENYGNNEIVISSNLTIEHIMPQTLSNTWKIQLGDKYATVHEKYLHTIGNLSLSGDNSQLGNKPFEDKKHILNEQSSLRMNRYFLSISEWNERTISDRAGVLYQEAKEIWSYPQDIVIFESELKEFYTLEDEVNITGKKVLSFELFGESYNIKSWIEMYKSVLKILLSLDDSVEGKLISSKAINYNKDKPNISRESSLMRRALPIEDNGDLYIEGNLSASQLLTFLRVIFEILELNGSDLIFYVNE